MPTDDERREVARRLRSVDMDDFSCYSAEFEGLYKAIGLYDGEEYAEQDWPERLADLIEPGEPQVKRELKYRSRCDELGAEMKRQRDALLKLADDIEDSDVTYSVSAQYVLDGYARRIREALGVES